MHPARELYRTFESLHVVTYFAPESAQAAKDAGLKGFWMGYFGFRAAPMGAVTAGAVEAVFSNFAPAMVARALPDAWSFADPEALVEVRAASVASALRRVAPSLEAVAAEATELLLTAGAAGSPLGRPLFAVNRDLARRDDPVEDLWQAITTVREHRGDGHVAALLAAGIDGCQAHVLQKPKRRMSAELLTAMRGWQADDVAAAEAGLAERGLVDTDGVVTDAGSTLRDELEARTDELAAAPAAALGEDGVARLAELLREPVEQVKASGVLP